MIDGLNALTAQLLRHIDYEEQSASPTIRRLLTL
jgi:hypothetical protein